MKLNKVFPVVLISVILLASVPFLLGLFWPRINDVATGATPEYPDILPQAFSQPRDAVFDAALATSKAMGWDVLTADQATGTIEAVATTRIFKFKDDVTITVTRETDRTVVNVRSRSRVGKSDLGENARRIRAFQAELMKRL
ncbi:MAG: DUF1499 domain-containing protein [Blastocatellales bacterium]